MLVGRSRETEAVDRLLHGARTGQSGVLVVRGAIGIGKSALLDYAAAQAEDILVLAATGVEAESELAFAALHQIFRPVLGCIAALPEPQAAALRSAFALSEETVADRFKVSAGVLSLLAEVSEERPVVCIVDDAQWLDRASADALLFAARRLEADSVAMLFGARDDDTLPLFVAQGVQELRLSPLPRAEARPVAEAALGSTASGAAVEWVLENANGNPLALIELPRSLSDEQRRGQEPLVSALPANTSVEQAYTERVERLPGPSRTMLVVAAAEATGDRATIERAARQLDAGPADLTPAEAAGLVDVRGDRIVFRHPLVRSAVYRRSGFAERERVHRALAAVLDRRRDADRRAWHRAAASVGPAADVADELERTAERARRRSGHAAAASALERAAELSVDSESEARRLVAAADEAWHAGQPDRASTLLDQAGPIVTNALVRADLDHLRGVIEWRCGELLEGSAILISGAARVSLIDPRRALEMLFDAGMAALNTGDAARVAEAAQRAAQLPRGDDASDDFLADLLVALGSMTRGKTARELPLVLDVIARADEFDDPQWLAWPAAAAAVAGEDASAAKLLRRAEALARSSGAVDTLSLVLAAVSVTGLLAGRFAGAARAAEGVGLAREAGLPNVETSYLAVLAWFAAIRGEDDECRTVAADCVPRARASGNALAASIAEWALALLDLERGRPEEAAERLLELRAAPPTSGHPLIVLTSTPDLVEACVRTDRAEEARAAFAGLEGFAGTDGPQWALALAARCRALLSRGADPEPAFQEAVRRHAETDRSFDTARTQLLFGEHLRRARRQREAREQLRAALETFQELGAAPWADRARSELRAAGETPTGSDTTALAQLTAQEQQVARFVEQGLSNKEVATQLFLSPRTVEYHLRKVFMKLGISSRAELIRLGAGAREASRAGS